MGDTPKCDSHIITDAEIKAIAFEVLGELASDCATAREYDSVLNVITKMVQRLKEV